MHWHTRVNTHTSQQEPTFLISSPLFSLVQQRAWVLSHSWVRRHTAVETDRMGLKQCSGRKAAFRPHSGRAQANCCSDTVVQLELHSAWVHVSLRKDSEKVPRRGTPLSSGDHKLWLVELTGTSCVCSFVLCSYLPRTGPQTDNYSLFQVASHCSSGVSLQCWSCAPARGRRWCTDGLCDLSILLAGVITVTLTRTFRNALQSHSATQPYARYAVFAFFFLLRSLRIFLQ